MTVTVAETNTTTISRDVTNPGTRTSIDEATDDHLTLTYDDAVGDRQPPSAWDWQTLLSLALHGQAPAWVKVGTYGPAKAVGDEPGETG